MDKEFRLKFYTAHSIDKIKEVNACSDDDTEAMMHSCNACPMPEQVLLTRLINM